MKITKNNLDSYLRPFKPKSDGASYSRAAAVGKIASYVLLAGVPLVCSVIYNRAKITALCKSSVSSAIAKVGMRVFTRWIPRKNIEEYHTYATKKLMLESRKSLPPTLDKVDNPEIIISEDDTPPFTISDVKNTIPRESPPIPPESSALSPVLPKKIESSSLSLLKKASKDFESQLSLSKDQFASVIVDKLFTVLGCVDDVDKKQISQKRSEYKKAVIDKFNEHVIESFNQIEGEAKTKNAKWARTEKWRRYKNGIRNEILRYFTDQPLNMNLVLSSFLPLKEPSMEK